MIYEWDDVKQVQNLSKHGLSFDRVELFDLFTAAVAPDLRKDYGEKRFVAVGFIGDRLYVLTYTLRRDKLRVISLRKANQRERKNYAQYTAKQKTV